MRVADFMVAKPIEGWKFATWAFSATWGLATLVPLVLLWTHLMKGSAYDWELWIVVAGWVVASSFIGAIFTNLIKLVARVEILEQELKSLRGSRAASN
jgi:hypothetical protein